ncbi:Maf family protein, partial [Methylobacterium sp.]|uniref:Maf family protein n=1 Tax=Methylobacterium sp. TaxID=409 RepID=UPI00272E2FC7
PTGPGVAGPAPGRGGGAPPPVLHLAGTGSHNPPARAGAAAHLARLQGRTHALHSAVALAVDGAVAEVFVVTARLAMRPLDEAGIKAYLDAAGPSVTGSVGAYQLEGVGIHLFDRIEGDHSTILGLPLLPLLARLRGRGLLAF